MGLFSQLTIEGWNEQLMEGLKKVVIFNDFAIKGGGVLSAIKVSFFFIIVLKPSRMTQGELELGII